MKPSQFLGLIKFYGNEDFLDKLIGGCFHCTPPERYRLDKKEGVADIFESCSYSYRPERGDEPIVIKIGNVEVPDALGATIHNVTDKDSWLHCWFSLRLPKDQEALGTLKSDIARMKAEFGEKYAFIPAPNLKLLVARLQELSRETMYCGEVKYSGDKSKWGTLCKALEYSYQREYRFLFGECSTSEKECYVFHDPNGFNKYILKTPDVKFQSNDGQTVLFDLRA